MPESTVLIDEKERILQLIVNGKLPEAMTLIVAKSSTLSTAIHVISLQIQADLNIYYDKHSKQMASNNDLPIIRERMIVFVNRIYAYPDEDGNIIPYSEDLIIDDFSLPFINRNTFRNFLKNEFKKVLENNASRLIFIDGSPKTGISYLQKYLFHVCEKYQLFKVISIDIPYHLDNPNVMKGNILMEVFDAEIGFEVKETNSMQDTIKFARFTTKLREYLKNEDTIKIFFIHDFHHIENSMSDINLQNFINELVSKISNNFPKSVFIITGYKYETIRNWKYLIRPKCAFYQIEPLIEDDIKACLQQLYKIYSDEICRYENSCMTETEFVNTTIDSLKESDGNFNLQIVGEFIMDYIFELKNN